MHECISTVVTFAETGQDVRSSSYANGSIGMEKIGESPQTTKSVNTKRGSEGDNRRGLDVRLDGVSSTEVYRCASDRKRRATHSQNLCPRVLLTQTRTILHTFCPASWALSNESGGSNPISHSPQARKSALVATGAGQSQGGYEMSVKEM